MLAQAPGACKHGDMLPASLANLYCECQAVIELRPCLTLLAGCKALWDTWGVRMCYCMSEEIRFTASHCTPPEACAALRAVIHCAGLKSRYAYAAVFSKVQGKYSGIMKFDLSAQNGGAVAGQIEHGSGRFGGEAVFVNGSGPGEGLLSPDLAAGGHA